MAGWLGGLVGEAGNKTNSALLSWGLAELGNTYRAQYILKILGVKNFDATPRCIRSHSPAGIPPVGDCNSILLCATASFSNSCRSWTGLGAGITSDGFLTPDIPLDLERLNKISDLASIFPFASLFLVSISFLQSLLL